MDSNQGSSPEMDTSEITTMPNPTQSLPAANSLPSESHIKVIPAPDILVESSSIFEEQPLPNNSESQKKDSSFLSPIPDYSCRDEVKVITSTPGQSDKAVITLNTSCSTDNKTSTSNCLQSAVAPLPSQNTILTTTKTAVITAAPALANTMAAVLTVPQPVIGNTAPLLHMPIIRPSTTVAVANGGPSYHMIHPQQHGPLPSGTRVITSVVSSGTSTQSVMSPREVTAPILQASPATTIPMAPSSLAASTSGPLVAGGGSAPDTQLCKQRLIGNLRHTGGIVSSGGLPSNQVLLPSAISPQQHIVALETSINSSTAGGVTTAGAVGQQLVAASASPQKLSAVVTTIGGVGTHLSLPQLVAAGAIQSNKQQLQPVSGHTQLQGQSQLMSRHQIGGPQGCHLPVQQQVVSHPNLQQVQQLITHSGHEQLVPHPGNPQVQHLVTQPVQQLTTQSTHQQQTMKHIVVSQPCHQYVTLSGQQPVQQFVTHAQTSHQQQQQQKLSSQPILHHHQQPHIAIPQPNQPPGSQQQLAQMTASLTPPKHQPATGTAAAKQLQIPQIPQLVGMSQSRAASPHQQLVGMTQAGVVPPHQQVVGVSPTGAAGNQQLNISGPSSQSSQLVGSVSNTSNSQAVQLPIVMGRPTPVSSQMLFQLPQSVLQLQQVGPAASGQPSKVMKFNSPLQLLSPSTNFSKTLPVPPRAVVSMSQPKGSNSTYTDNKVISPRFITATAASKMKTSLQILPKPTPPRLTAPLTQATPPRKSIVLKNPSGSGGATPSPGYVAISPDSVKPFTGKIVGKVPPGVLRFSNPGLKANQVYLTKIDPQGNTVQIPLQEDNTVMSVGQSQLGNNKSASSELSASSNSPSKMASELGDGEEDKSLSSTVQKIYDAPDNKNDDDDEDDEEEYDDELPVAEENPVCRKLNLEDDIDEEENGENSSEPGDPEDLGDDNGDLSLECDEEFDDSFEKKDELSTHTEDGNDIEDDRDDTTEEEYPDEDTQDDDSSKPEQHDDDNPEEDGDNKPINDGLAGGIQTVDLLKPLPDHSTASASSVALKTNEFGMMEFDDLGFGSPTPKPLKAETDTDKQPVVLHSPNPRKESMARRIQDDEILYCEGCGCYGMAGEFVAQNSCSNTCNNLLLSRSREKQRRERELEVLRMRRDERKIPQAKLKKRGLPANATEEEINNWKCSQYNSTYPWQDVKKGFVWSKYLEYCGSRAAPSRLFPGEPFPDQHLFREGMKLEAIDPLHQSLICVVTVAEVCGPRLRLHFDGYGDSHDFYENADSDNLFPAKWCSKNKQKLTPPKGFARTQFDWDMYLRQTRSIAAPDEVFAGRTRAAVGADSAVHGWKIGMKLEACDRQNKSLVCVATVGNVMEGRILLHFDGWEMDYDYWTKAGSQNVKPVGWCTLNNKQLNPPKGNHPSVFSWKDYLASTKSKSVPAWAFRSPGSFRDESDFQEGMRLEAVDVYNPKLVRVASIAAIEGRQLELHYDGWPDEMNQWVEDDHSDIHPCGWAAKTGHPLMAPLTPQEVKYWSERGGCEIPGCRGIGHIKGAKYTSHHSISACPYAPHNLEINNHIPDRLQGFERDQMEQNNFMQSQSGEPGLGQQLGQQLGRGNRRRKKRKFFDDEAQEEARGNREDEPERKRGSFDEDEEERFKDAPTDGEAEDRDNSVDAGNGIRHLIGSKGANRRSSSDNSQIKKENPDIKEEAQDLLPPTIKKEPGVGSVASFPVKQEPTSVSSVCVQTDTPSTPSPPPFYTEWEEGVRRSVWQPGYLPQPEPPGTLSANWKEHSKILLGGRADSPLLTINKARYWDTNQVVDFLSSIPNLEYDILEELVRDHQIDGESLLLLTQNDITQLLGVKLGPAIKIYNAIMAVRMRRE